MEQWWNDIDRGNPKTLERNLLQCHFVHNKSHMDCPGYDPGPLLEVPINRICTQFITTK
jgi:hypothetical protein